MPPLAGRALQNPPPPASHILGRNLMVYGIGGIILPFIGIKAVDLLVNAIGLA
jgi:K+-transporting ATPase ATPase B chain